MTALRIARRARRPLALFAAYVVGYRIGRYEGRVAAWRTDLSGARRVA